MSADWFALLESRWHHFLYIFDSDNDVGNDRIRLYLDGTRVGLMNTQFTNGNDKESNAPGAHGPKGFESPVGHSSQYFRIGDFDRFAADRGYNW